MENKCLDDLATEAGIATEYINAYGKPQAIPAQIRHRILQAMGTNIPVERPVSDLAALPLPTVEVLMQGKAFTLTLDSSIQYQWQIQTEQGEDLHGNCQYQLTLPASLPLGYHTLILTPISGQKDDTQHHRMQIIITPERCYEPKPLKKGHKLWGACVQLYTLRSENNWGIGDFGDLKQMLRELAQRGGAFIGLNPLHAMYPAMPENASPYSPSSRHWLNVIYIDVNQVEDFKSSTEAQTWWQSPETQHKLQHARQTEWVDYSTVVALKMTALRLAYQQFNTRTEADPLYIAFRQFITQGGKSLYSQAVYDALLCKLYSESHAYWGWPVWPEKYREPDSDTVQEFCHTHSQEVAFFLWLQWIADRQLADCFSESQNNSMPIGIYRDLAVGVAQGGSETWENRELYCTEASIGAPPDILGPLGQNWGLPPMNPHVLQAQHYQPFIELLRSNMRHCGALRIDHVMALLRLWWIPQGESAAQGVYVHYPVDDLLAILALESQRHCCMVIGEDLGIVPEEIVGKLRNYGVYSYKVFYFERDGQGEFKSPDEYTTQAMATITTHDLPTLRGFWQSDDLKLGESIGLYPDSALLAELYDEREHCKQKLLAGLHRSGYLSESLSITNTPIQLQQEASSSQISVSINHDIHYYLASSASALLGLQPEDWLDMEHPVNVPGTTREYPNWRRKLTVTLEAIFKDERVNHLLETVDKHRRTIS
ncbi:4-alpha-glucanotransferase [Xenorhabdus cabanillasii]|uniref:4-alpha-glucanotransferase n=1 Tax=Xenorhabdus cabanillasii JM26 TaxID=1427517 RepID=W1IQD2_9GAMM|nr:4-alpha-glucanotransferase [Xenorhabdus cabanillasii]PHM79109.1 4-alpha-glucanotransferase [Xenorhabdus cabanillasii JM26]CDL80038.1 4-alpha-glucanotransferase [Xenorhabdus cabanillasii JM26]